MNFLKNQTICSTAFMLEIQKQKLVLMSLNHEHKHQFLNSTAGDVSQDILKVLMLSAVTLSDP